MAATKTRDFKDPLWITAWLDAALKKEKDKYEKCPPTPDLVPGHVEAQAWGYVVVGYFLVEESLKAVLFVRGTPVPAHHSLSTLFNCLNRDDKQVLREYYTDYRATAGGNLALFPFECLDDFLANLDGDKNRRGDHMGSFDWRYFLIEEKQSQKMPLVSVDYLHEIAFGAARLVECTRHGRSAPSRYTRSWRLRRQRQAKYYHWFMVRMNSCGWDELGDRLEILWGADYLGRYDLYLFKGRGRRDYFSAIPDQFALPVIDKREEVEAFDVDEGYRSIGFNRMPRPPLV